MDWVKRYVQEHGYDSLGIYIGGNDTETGVELGTVSTVRPMVFPTSLICG